MTRSRRLAAVALSGAVALSCAVLTAPAHAAPSVDTPVATVQLSSSLPTEIDYTWAGSSGFRYRLPENSGTLQWADYPGVTPPAHAGPDDLTTGTDVITSVSGATVTQQHRSTGVTATVTVPSGQTYRAASGWSVLTQDAAGAPHVLRAAADGTTTDLPVTGLPDGAQLTGTFVTGGSVRRLAVVYTHDGATDVGLVDLADGTFRTYLTGVGNSPRIVFNDRWVVNGTKAIRVDSAPGTAPSTITASFLGEAQAVVGDQLLTGNAMFLPGGATPNSRPSHSPTTRPAHCSPTPRAPSWPPRTAAPSPPPDRRASTGTCTGSPPPRTAPPPPRRRSTCPPGRPRWTA